MTRLVEMGVEPFNVSASLIGVLAQRLVRRVCRHCRVEYTPDPDVLRRIGMSEDEIQGRKLYRGVGCEKCSGRGYNGRYAMHELLIVDDELANAIVRDASALELKELAVAAGMRTSLEDGLQKRLDGIPHLEPMLATNGEWTQYTVRIR